MVVTLATVVMDVRRNDEVAYGFEARCYAALEMRVPSIEAQLHVRQARLLEEMFQVCGTRHFTRRVFKRKRDAALSSEQGQEFQGTKRRIPSALVRNIARPGHVLNAIAEWNVFHQIQSPLNFVHGLLSPHSLGIGNR